MSETQNSSPAPFPAGTLVDDEYEVLEPLGGGAYSHVVKARDLTTGSLVAIKFLSGANARQLAKEGTGFVEASADIAKILHPNLTTVLGYGIFDGRFPYTVTPLLAGRSLDRELEDAGPMAVGRALCLVIDALEALDVAHQQGVVHADIKPSNLFVHGGPPESMHVLDLGLAELKRGNPGSSQVLGSSRYMSPEFISKSLLTTALDVYQMGLVLAEMISGRPAVDAANTFACSLRHCKGELDIPEPLTVPPLAKVMDEALVIDHRLRFATAGAFAKALNGCLPAFGGRQTTEELTRVDDDLRVTAPTTSHDLPDTRPNSPPVGATAAAIPTALSQQAAPTRGREPLSLEERVEQRLATAGDDVTREIPVKVAKALDEDARLATAPDPDTPTRPTNRAAHTPD